MSAEMDVVSDLMMCAVCYENAATDPVSMTCKAQHVFCFECIFNYFRSRAISLGSLSCPSCRHGNGSFLVMKRLKDLYHASQSGGTAAMSDAVNSSQYYDSLEILKNRFPRRFRYATDSCVVSAAQMSVFVQNYTVLQELLGAGDLTVDMIEEKSWRGPDGRLLPRRMSTRMPRPRRGAPVGVPTRNIPVAPSLFTDGTTRMLFDNTRPRPSTGIMEGILLGLTDDDFEVRRNPPRRARPTTFDEGTQVSDDDENEQVGADDQTNDNTDADEDTPFLNAALRFLSSISVDQAVETANGGLAGLGSMGAQVSPYNLRPRNLTTRQNNSELIRCWVGIYSIAHIAVLVRGGQSNFRVSLSLSSARTFINNHLDGASNTKAFIVAVALGNETITVGSLPHNRVVPLLKARPVTNVEMGSTRLELVPVENDVSIMDFFSSEFDQGEVRQMAHIWSMIAEINNAYSRGHLQTILCREMQDNLSILHDDSRAM